MQEAVKKAFHEHVGVEMGRGDYRLKRGIDRTGSCDQLGSNHRPTRANSMCNNMDSSASTYSDKTVEGESLRETGNDQGKVVLEK